MVTYEVVKSGAVVRNKAWAQWNDSPQRKIRVTTKHFKINS